ncbi:MAG: hypothetical protein KC621_14920 [Myxococcales bacterium]|nr:hypothetical protein [Myxococcales bacterium]
MKLLHVLTLSTLLVGCIRAEDGPYVVREVEDGCGIDLREGDEVMEEYLPNRGIFTVDLPTLDTHLRCDREYDEDVVHCDPVEQAGTVDDWSWTYEDEELFFLLDREREDGEVCEAEFVASRPMVLDEETAATVGLIVAAPDPVLWGGVVLVSIADAFSALGAMGD